MPEPSPHGRPLIAVVGSLDAARQDYQPPLQDPVRGIEACRQIGGALAAAGCDLLVFSSKPHYAESPVVDGYVAAATQDAPGRLVARPPRHRAIAFDIPADSGTQVVVQPDTSGEWELSYYRSLLSADGIVLVGGGRSTRIAGIFALLQRIPVLPIAAFGGGASQVWVNLDKQRNDATPDEVVRMGQPWADDAAGPLVAGLLAQRARRLEHRADDARALRRRALAARTALILTLVSLVVSWLGVAFVQPGGTPGTGDFLLLLAIPMVASAAGALLRNFKQQEQWGWAAARGLAAGFVTVFVYLAGELVSVPDLLDRLDVQRLLFFLGPLALTAGFAFDKVLERVLSGQTTVPALNSAQQQAPPP